MTITNERTLNLISRDFVAGVTDKEHFYQELTETLDEATDSTFIRLAYIIIKEFSED